jgi:hypothetical protein
MAIAILNAPASTSAVKSWTASNSPLYSNEEILVAKAKKLMKKSFQPLILLSAQSLERSHFGMFLGQSMP